MSSTTTAQAAPIRREARSDNRWLILATVAVAQLMVVLDITIVNIALPSAQRDLGFATDSRQWVITAYALAFGSLLLVGGRLSDLFGSRWTLLVGLLGFAGASALGGAAPSFALLVSARVLQGVFAAVLAPAALATLNLTFTDSKERARAFGIYSAVAAGGSVVGLILGGMLTEWFSWRWCLYVSLGFALPCATGVLAWIRPVGAQRSVQFDLPGALTACGGLFCLVYGLSNAEQHSWSAPLTIAMLVSSGVLLIGFVLLERVVNAPLLPLRVVTDRDRAASFLAIGTAFSVLFGVFLFVTYFLQQGLAYSPLKTGIAFLPVTVGVLVSAGSANAVLVPRLGARRIVPAGFLIACAAMSWLAQLSTSSTYASDVLGPMFLLGIGIGYAFAPAISTATADIAADDAGVASAMVNTSQQIGGAVGTAALSTVFSSAVSSYLESHHAGAFVAAAAAVHGYTAAFTISAYVLLCGALVTALLFRNRGRVQS